MCMQMCVNLYIVLLVYIFKYLNSLNASSVHSSIVKMLVTNKGPTVYLLGHGLMLFQVKYKNTKHN